MAAQRCPVSSTSLPHHSTLLTLYLKEGLAPAASADIEALRSAHSALGNIKQMSMVLIIFVFVIQFCGY